MSKKLNINFVTLGNILVILLVSSVLINYFQKGVNNIIANTTGLSSILSKLMFPMLIGGILYLTVKG